MRNLDDLLRRALWWVPVAALAVLAGCGGGGDAGVPDPAVPGAPAVVTLDTLGPDGGTVHGAEGVVVQVPAEALETEVTVRVAADSTGAPALPGSLRAIGSIYEITPHGHRFARGVTVRLPVPDAARGSEDSLVILHAEPGGTWTTLAGENRGDGMLEVEVDTLGWFAVGRFARSQALATTTQPIAWNMTTLCGGVACPGLGSPGTGTYPVTVTVTSNGGVLPNTCAAPRLEVNLVEIGIVNSLLRRTIKIGQLVPLTGGTVGVSAARPTWTNEAEIELVLRCSGLGPQTFGKSATLAWKPLPAYPRLLIEATPASLQAVPGSTASLQLTFAGGAAKATTTAATAFTVPTDADRAVIDWQRSDDAGGSWRSIATSYQNESGNTRPYAGWPLWRFWTARTGIAVTASDAGARFRARACYAKPGTTEASCVTSRAVPLTLLAVTSAPAITTQPASRLILGGQTASFTVAATGLPAPTLQWQSRPGNLSSDFADIPGATGTSYTTPVLQTSSNGVQYRVIATNAIGSTGSLPATVAVSAAAVAPVIANAPTPLTVVSGSDAVFAVRAVGTEALSFQWRRNGVDLPGANGAVLRLATVTDAQAGDYSVVVSNAAGSVTSPAAALTVNTVPGSLQPPTIAASPASVTVAQGQSVSLVVSVTGSGPFTYQWRKGSIDVPGATEASYTIASADTGDAGNYRVVVSANGTSVTSGMATLWVTPATAPVAPTITTQPASVVVVPGSTTTLAVAASGTGPLSYQWYLGTVAIESPSAGTPVLTLASVRADMAGSYTVKVSNAQGMVTSVAANVIVVGAPVAGTLPATASGVEGQTAAFSISATGSNLRYQWTRNSVAIAGATGASYTTPVLTLADDGAVYGVLVYNSVGLVIVPGSVLSVSPAPAARSWQPPARLQNSAIQTEGDVPDIVADGAGNLRAAWVERSSGGVNTIVTARLTPADGWEAPVTVANLGNNFASQVKVAVNDLGHVVLAWLQNPFGGASAVWAASYTPINGWQTQVRLDVDTAKSYAPLGLAMDVSGNAIVMWQHDIAASPGVSGIFHARFVAGSGWTTASALTMDPGVTAAYSPRVRFDAAGNAIAVWLQSGPQGNDFASARWVPGSAWTASELIENSNAFFAGRPEIAVNANGDAVAVWTHDFEIWSNRRPAGGNWGSAVRVRPPPMYTESPRVTIDAAGNAVAIWLEPDGDWTRVWASRSSAATGWSPPVAVSPAGFNGYDPALAGNAAGDAVIAWRSDNGVAGLTTMVATYTPAGGWGAATAIEPTQVVRPPAAAMAADGDAAVIWPRQDANAWQVWTSRYR
jgi:hypothetical protein